MNNSLHNDLERLGHASSYSSRKMSPHPTLNSSDLNRSTLSYSKRVRFADPTEHLEVIRKPEFSSKDIEEAASKGIKVQRELMDLQSKVLALERRISSVYSPTHMDIVKENWQSCYNVRMNTADSENRPPLQKQNVLKASLKSSGSEWAKTTGNFEDSGLLEQDKLKLSGSSSHRSRSRPKSHRRRLSDASFMKEKTVKRDYSRSNMNDSYEYSSMRLTTDMTETKKFRANDQEVLILNRNIDKLRKEYEEDKEALACEKAKGKNLSEEVRKLTKQMQEAKINLDNAKKAKKNFDKLKESYERSEEVKEQQKQLISNLDYELALLKAEKYKLLEGKKNEEAKRCKDSYKKAKIAMKIGKSYY